MAPWLVRGTSSNMLHDVFLIRGPFCFWLWESSASFISGRLDERQLRGQESDAMAYVLPTAVTKMECVNLTVPLTELFDSLKPSTRNVDEVDIGRDQKRHIDGIVCIPGVRPSPDHRCNGGPVIEKICRLFLGWRFDNHARTLAQ